MDRIGPRDAESGTRGYGTLIAMGGALGVVAVLAWGAPALWPLWVAMAVGVVAVMTLALRRAALRSTGPRDGSSADDPTAGPAR